MKVHKRLGLIIFLTVLFLLAVAFGVLYLNWQRNYKDRVYPGIKIGNTKLEKLNFSEAEETIKGQSKKIEEDGFKIENGEKIINISTDIFSFDSDLSAPTLSFDYLATAQAAYGDEADRNFYKYLLDIFKPAASRKIKMIYALDENKIKDLLNTDLSDLNIPPANAYFIFDNNAQIKIVPEKLGKEINYDQTISDIKNNLDNLNDSLIVIKTRTKYPDLSQTDLESLNSDIKKIVGTENLVLKFKGDTNNASSSAASTEDLSWTIKPDKLITWLSISRIGDKPSLSLDKEKIKQYLVLNAVKKISRDIVLPRFDVVDNKVSSWQNGVKGRELDVDQNAQIINDAFLQNKREIFLIAKETGDFDSTLTNNLNIKEIIGTGVSDFSGSPVNRVKNIKVGAAAAQGLLIKPGEEFSLVKTLGDVSAETGYFPELVIKGNKTLPEYGGGLCQIGTTIFRAALASGLPITYRQNHSYRVAYYEPAGTDAAVYIPNPDVRFLNDTGNYILIQTRFVKSKIYFDFWGTSDGRIASTTTPVIYNITKPDPPKYIETNTLAAGTEKCTEHAHNGADAYFDYTVTYPTSATSTPIVKERRFKSHYVPWQEVCLIGARTATTSSSTISIIDLNTSSTTKKQ